MLFESNSLHQVEGYRHLERGNLLRLVFLDFRKTFPKIEFELQAESRTINAQAIIHGEARIVRLYGGLAFHSLAESDLLVFTLLHEVGHHLSSGGRLAFCESLGCECAADRWALTKGLSRFEKRVRRTLNIEKAVASLDALEAEVTSRRAIGSEGKDGLARCWALDWPKRKLHLAGLIPMPLVRRCHLSEFYVS
jgi:hypothetical protein